MAMFFNDFTAPDGKSDRMDGRKPKITAITPADKLFFSQVDLDTIILWRAEADAMNLPPEAEDAFFKEKITQFRKSCAPIEK